MCWFSCITVYVQKPLTESLYANWATHSLRTWESCSHTYDVEETSAYTTRLHTVNQKSHQQVLGCFRCLHLRSATAESLVIPSSPDQRGHGDRGQGKCDGHWRRNMAYSWCSTVLLCYGGSYGEVVPFGKHSSYCDKPSYSMSLLGEIWLWERDQLYAWSTRIVPRCS